MTFVQPSLGKKATIHGVTTMLATSKNVVFPGHNLLLTTSADDQTLYLLPKHQQGYLRNRRDVFKRTQRILHIESGPQLKRKLFGNYPDF